MERKKFIEAGAAAGLLAGLGYGERAGAATPSSGVNGRAPNILFMLVDQLRFPTELPAGIKDTGEFLRRHMPNTYKLWSHGVKFTNHHTAGNACTPARGTLITGLYTQQSWLLLTILSTPGQRIALQPHLNKAYPTYGRLLKNAGYQTPYIGKWHVSLETPRDPGLDGYGFQGLTTPDPTGSNLQGTIGNTNEGYLNDGQIAAEAVNWLHGPAPRQGPWCLTVSFVNPHDKEFFWAGTEFATYNPLFPVNGPLKPFNYYSQIIDGKAHEPLVNNDENILKAPRRYGYNQVPRNWETPQDIAHGGKPTTQTYVQLFTSAVWGGASFDPHQNGFTVEPYPIPANGSPPKQYGVARAPFSYWERNLDSYTQVMEIVDKRIGEVLEALLELPKDVLGNTVVVFTSDHGELGGAHGFLSGKMGTCYEEAWHIPLIVADPTGRFNRDIGTPRNGLTSSVDILPFLVTLAHGGSREWLTPELRQLYGRRHDVFSMLRSGNAPGRDYVLFSTDEIVPGFYNFNSSPGHIVGMRTQNAKFGIYAHWVGTSDTIDTNGLQTEFYDYSTDRGRLELDSDPQDSRALAMRRVLLNDLIPNELRAPLPPLLRGPQALDRKANLAYFQFMQNYTVSQDAQNPLPQLLGYGKNF